MQLSIGNGELRFEVGTDIVVTTPTKITLDAKAGATFDLCRVVTGHTVAAPDGIELEPGRWAWRCEFDKSGPILALRNVETGVEVLARIKPKAAPPTPIAQESEAADG